MRGFLILLSVLIILLGAVVILSQRSVAAYTGQQQTSLTSPG